MGDKNTTLVRERRSLLQEIAELETPAAKHAQKILDRLEDETN